MFIAPSWQTFDAEDSTFLSNAVRVGSFAPGVTSFIGRHFVNGEVQIGRIQLVEPTGLFYSIDGEIKFTEASIEYLVADKYTWKNSSNGNYVKDAVPIGSTSKNQLPYYIARYNVNNQFHVGIVIRILGIMHYSDENGIERSTDCYEVLVCSSSEEGNFFIISHDK